MGACLKADRPAFAGFSSAGSCGLGTSMIAINAFQRLIFIRGAGDAIITASLKIED